MVSLFFFFLIRENHNMRHGKFRGCFNQISIVLPYLGENLQTLEAFVSISYLLLGTILKVLSTRSVHLSCKNFELSLEVVFLIMPLKTGNLALPIKPRGWRSAARQPPPHSLPSLLSRPCFSCAEWRTGAPHNLL